MLNNVLTLPEACTKYGLAQSTLKTELLKALDGNSTKFLTGDFNREGGAWQISDTAMARIYGTNIDEAKVYDLLGELHAHVVIYARDNKTVKIEDYRHADYPIYKTAKWVYLDKALHNLQIFINTFADTEEFVNRVYKLALVIEGLSIAKNKLGSFAKGSTNTKTVDNWNRLEIIYRASYFTTLSNADRNN